MSLKSLVEKLLLNNQNLVGYKLITCSYFVKSRIMSGRSYSFFSNLWALRFQAWLKNLIHLLYVILYKHKRNEDMLYVLIGKDLHNKLLKETQSFRVVDIISNKTFYKKKQTHESFVRDTIFFFFGRIKSQNLI